MIVRGIVSFSPAALKQLYFNSVVANLTESGCDILMIGDLKVSVSHWKHDNISPDSRFYAMQTARIL